MISSAKLVQHLNNTSFKKIPLPNSNKYTQFSSYEKKKREMDEIIKNMELINNMTNVSNVINTNVEELTQSFDDLMKNNEKIDTSKNERRHINDNNKNIDYDSYINYTESEMIKLPVILINILDK